MNLNKSSFVILFLLFCTLISNSQVLRQFNGVVEVKDITTIIPNVEDHCTLTYSDPGHKYVGTNVMVGDRVIDRAGNSFLILIISSANDVEIIASVKCLDATEIVSGVGVIYRPSVKGVDLLGLANDPILVGTVINSALIGLDKRMPEFSSGSVLPTPSIAVGSVGSYGGVMYQFTITGWVEMTGIPDAFGLSSGTVGDVVKNIFDGAYYVCAGGSVWNPPTVLTELYTLPKLGDVFYNTTENKLYMMGSNGVWMAISGSSILAGPISDLPTSPKTGDFFFENVNNILYVYDALSRWVEVSINGSTPKGIINPDPLMTTIKEGELFYNTTDKKLYFYNGTAWATLTNSLTSGQIFIGNSSNVPVSMTLSGDAKINNIGKLTINNAAITDSKLDKANIPINGFGYANNDIVIGTGSPFYQIRGVANPTNPEDVSTKSYVDLSLSAPFLLGLAYNSVFVGNSSNKAIVVLKNALPLSDFGRATASISMGPVGGPYTNKITELANPFNPQDAATKSYVDTHVILPAYISLGINQLLVGTSTGTASQVTKSAVPISDFGAATADVLMGGKNLKNLHEPVNPQDAATMNYVDSKTLSLTSNYVFQGDGTNTPVGVPKTAIPLNDWGAATASVSMGGTNLINLADPVGMQDAATRKYVDGKIGSVTISATPPTVGTLGAAYYNTTDKTYYISDGSQWVPVNNILPTGQFYVGNATNKAVATPKSSIPLSGFGLPIADFSAGSFKMIGLADPTNDQDAATKKYVDVTLGSLVSGIPLAKGNMLVGDASGKAASIAKSVITLSGFGDAESNISMGTGSNNYKIINVANPTGDQDAATKYYVDKKVITPTSITLTTDYILVGNASNQAAAVAKSNVSLSEFGAITSNLSLAGYQITNMADPVTAQDAVTKKYVDNSLASFSSIPSLTLGYLFVGDATNKALATAKNVIPLSGFAAAAADVDLGTHKLVNVTDPSGNQDAATKKYVDTQVTGVKLAQIVANTMLGNNTASTADAVALTPLQVKAMLSLNNVDNTSDATKNVLSATKLTTATKINGIDFDGSANITIPGDNMGNHTATQNIKTITFAINSDGANGKGLSFDTPGNAAFAQDVTVNGNFYTPSDQRLKTNIVTLGNALQAINSIRGVRFEYKDQKKYAKGPKIGVIAQELVKVFPEMVTKGADGFFKVDYTQLTAVLIQAVKEQQTMMHQQQVEIDGLKVRLNNQQLQINAILKKIE